MDGASRVRHHPSMLCCRIICLVLGSLFAQTPTLADVYDFARAPAFDRATLSPDGLRVSFIEQRGGKQSVFVREVTGTTARATLSVEPPRERIHECQWIDSRYVLCATILTERKQHTIVESTRLYTIDSSLSRAKALASASWQNASLVDATPHRGEEALVQHDPEGHGFPEVVELNVVTGKSRVVLKSKPPVRSWMSDGRGNVRLGVGYEKSRASVLARMAGSHEWRQIIDQDLSDVDAIGPLALGANDALFALKHHKGRTALFRMNLIDRSSARVLFSDSLYDVSGPVELHPSTRELLAVRYLAESATYKAFDENEAKLREWIESLLPSATNTIASRSLDNRIMLIVSSSDTSPPSVFFADAQRRRLELLAHQYPELEAQSLAPTTAFMYAARDGQRIPAYLTLPRVSRQPARAVVLPHGGPETRDVKGFNPVVQFLAAQGFAVLQMNFRGSLGYGAGFAAAGAREWGGVIHNDITDAARWLVANRIADPAHICIVGISFGGYAALMGAVKESQWYACAASFAGPADLMALGRHLERSAQAALWRERLGSDMRALWETSPLAHAARSETPILIVHGLRDAVVPVSQSRRLARELKRQSKPHEYVERADCDHDLTAESCRFAVFTAFRDFIQGAGAAKE